MDSSTFTHDQRVSETETGDEVDGGGVIMGKDQRERRLTRVIVRFYGGSENAREVEMDMKEMVGKVKAGEPLYGISQLSPHMQGVAARQSRYSTYMFAAIPWFNFVNHNQHGVDTAKYYQQAERELEAERREKEGL